MEIGKVYQRPGMQDIRVVCKFSNGSYGVEHGDDWCMSRIISCMDAPSWTLKPEKKKWYSITYQYKSLISTSSWFSEKDHIDLNTIRKCPAWYKILQENEIEVEIST